MKQATEKFLKYVMYKFVVISLIGSDTGENE